MSTLFTDEEYEYIVGGSESMALDAIWYELREEKFPTHEERRDAFLWLLERGLNDGKLIIVGEDYKTPLPGTPQEVVQLFRDAWPKTEKPWDFDGPGNDIGCWLYGPPNASPGHPLWRVVHEDGKVEWIPG